MPVMPPFFRHTRLWLLILCLIGNGLVPLGAAAGTRIWSKGMDICFSVPPDSPSSDNALRHPVCCCHVSNATVALPSPYFQHVYATPKTRANATPAALPVAFNPFGHVRSRGPPDPLATV